MTRPLPEQFEALHVDVQSRMFRLLDVIAGMSHDEKATTGKTLTRARHAVAQMSPDDPALGVLQAVETLVVYVDMAARGGFPKGSMGIDEALRTLKEAGDLDGPSGDKNEEAE